MDDTFPVPRAPLPNITPRASTAPAKSHTVRPSHAPSDIPFMSNMEEISYWITTKQAPCLFNYDNVIKRQCEQAQCSKPKSVQSMVLDETPKKKKKRKLSLLDDESVSTEKQRNVYFETSQHKTQTLMLDSSKSLSLSSDLDIIIKKPPLKNKSKKTKLNKSNRSTVHKKNKIATSTPKVVGNLRRSLRKAQRNNNSHLNDSFEVFNCELINSNNSKFNNIVCEKERSSPKSKKALQLFAGGDQSTNKQKSDETTAKVVKISNGQFDDMSDVSGFTANYIRSTKIHSSKKIRNNVRNKGSKNLMKDSQPFSKKVDNTMILCLNKSVNTGMPKTPLMNCSTDSSQNVLNLVTLKTHDKSTRVSRSTSLLKFMDTRKGNKRSCDVDEKVMSSGNINASFVSKNTSITSRYPIRHKNSSVEHVTPVKFEKMYQEVDKRRNNKTKTEFNNSDRKENPVDKLISRTRSGKCIGLMLRQPENSVLVLSNSMEPVSSLATLNVATPPNPQTRSRSKRRSCTSTKPYEREKQEQSDRRQSLRERSGFAACFSDSDDDNRPMQQKKFFC